MNQTELMPEAQDRQGEMPWKEAVSVVDWAVNQHLQTIEEWPQDYDPEMYDKLIRAWSRVLRG